MSITLTDLPATIVCSGVCPFLDLEDLLNLRVASRILHGHLHNEHDISNELWKLVLLRDFGLPLVEPNSGIDDKGQEIIWTIPAQQTSGVSKLATDGMVVPVTGRFEAVKAWKRVSIMFYSGAPVTVPPIRKRIHAPYFLRAARFWQSICRWCHEADPDGPASTQARLNIYKYLAKSGLKFTSWPTYNQDTPHSMHAVQAVYAFSTMNSSDSDYNRDFAPLFGGCRAYGSIASLTRFLPLRTDNILYLAVGMYYRLCTDVVTGCVFIDPGRRPAVNLPDTGGQALDNRPEQLLLWLEEYARRLTTGEIGIGRLENDYTEDERRGIVLYPRYIPGLVESSHQIPIVSRRVTHGIEVIASAVFVGHMGRFGEQSWFVYSIRIRLLCPDDEGYVSPEERGFLHCQLLARHWRITNHESGSTSEVDGRGVIGMFPVLREGGFTEGGHSSDGVFEYQSCTGPMPEGGTFEGNLTFVADPPAPGTWDPETVALYGVGAFQVEVGAFVLDSRPAYLY